MTIFTLFLEALGVPSTAPYNDRRFRTMPFQSLFGFSRLLKEYGVDSQGLYFDSKENIGELPAPSLLQYKGRFVVLTAVSADTVSFCDTSGSHQRERGYFLRYWSGVALVAYPSAGSMEPDYRRHRFMDFVTLARKVALTVCALFLLTMAFIGSGIYRHWAPTAVMCLDLAGIFVSWQLMLKSVGIHTRTGSRLCGVIQAEGCDTVLADKASSFYGIVSWSEVGLGYFGISLLALLIFPQSYGWLAVFNCCCLPFSFWSVWYQKFRAKAWCTMCLTVQALLWVIFICNLCGGAFREVHAGGFTPWLLIAAYVAAVLAANALASGYKRLKVLAK